MPRAHRIEPIEHLIDGKPFSSRRPFFKTRGMHLLLKDYLGLHEQGYVCQTMIDLVNACGVLLVGEEVLRPSDRGEFDGLFQAALQSRGAAQLL